MRNFIKKDVIERTAQICGIEPKEAAAAVNAVFRSLRDMMTEKVEECRVEIRSFGVFEVKNTAARSHGRNPKKPQETIYIPARRKTHFRPGRLLKNELKKPIK